MPGQIKIGTSGNRYIVFINSEEAEIWAWLYWNTLGCQRVCFGGYDNAYLLN